MHKKKKSVWKKILWLIRPYLHFLMLSFVFAGISALLTLYAPILIGNAVDLILGKGSVDFDAIGRILFRLAGIIVITSAAQWLMNLCNNHITYRVVKDVRTKAFAKLQKLPLKYVDSHAYGETISRIITDVEQFSDGLLMGFTQFFTGVVTILGTLVFMDTVTGQWRGLIRSTKSSRKSACRRFSFRPLRIRVPGLSTDWCIQGLVLQVRLPQSEAGSRWGSCLAF